MQNKPAQAYAWNRVFYALQNGDIEQAWVHFYRQFRESDTVPWMYFFDFLDGPPGGQNLYNNDMKYQRTTLDFIERNLANIQKYLLKRLTRIYLLEHNEKMLRICMKKFGDKMSKVGRQDLQEAIKAAIEKNKHKRRLSNPTLPESKQISLDKSQCSNCTDYNQGNSESPVCSEKLQSPAHAEVQIPDETVDDDADKNSTFCEISTGYTIDINKSLKENDRRFTYLIGAGLQFRFESIEFQGVSYESINAIIERMKNSRYNRGMYLRNISLWIVVPFLANKDVCTSADSDLISDFLGYDCEPSSFVLEILMTCKTQIIEETAKMVSVKPALAEEISCRLDNLPLWSEDVTTFLALIVKDDCSVTAVEHVMRYLIECSNEKSSNSCQLVLRILLSRGKNESILKLCAEFAQQNECFLYLKALLPKLHTFIE